MASISDILLDQGRRAAEMRRQRANVWTPTIQQLANLPGQIMQDRQAADDRRVQQQDAAQDRQYRDLQIRQGEQEMSEAESERQRRQQLAEIVSDMSLYDEQGLFDKPKALSIAQSKGYATLGPDLDRYDNEHDASVFKRLSAGLELDAAKNPVPKTREIKTVGPDGSETIQVIEDRPGQTFTSTPRPPMREIVVKGPNGRPVKKLVPESELMQGIEQYEAPRAGAAPSFQARDVLNDAGQPVMANFDARTGQYTDPSTGQPIKNPRPVPSPLETQDARKFKQAEPILNAVSELSEKINTQSGLLAKMSGGVEKAKAQANYNDDVAEYEALISGFTPLVARALGHTGVLTQQDVDSVKALFPKPGDSKTLRDRKIARIRSIIGELETNASPGPSGSPNADGWIELAPGVRVREKP